MRLYSHTRIEHVRKNTRGKSRREAFRTSHLSMNRRERREKTEKEDLVITLIIPEFRFLRPKPLKNKKNVSFP